MAQPRKPAGMPDGGQWRPAAHAEEDIPLLPEGVRPELATKAASGLVITATPKEVDWLLDNGTPGAKVGLSHRDDLARAQYLRLLHPEQPRAAKLNVLARLEPGLAEVAAEDPDPIVRAYALVLGWDLPEGRACALRADPEVVRVAQKLNLL